MSEPQEKSCLPPGALSTSLEENLIAIRALFQNSSDLVIHPFTVCGCDVALLCCEGMVQLQVVATSILQPLTMTAARPLPPIQLRERLREQLCLALDQNEIRSMEDLARFMMSGFVVIIVDGVDSALSFGAQGFNFRSIAEPSGENNVRGSREGFVEVLRINMTMIRRRIKSPQLHFELLQAGKVSGTDLCLCYLEHRVSRDTLRTLRERLAAVPLDMVLESGFLQPFLESRRVTLFPCVGTTERPDTVCAKINEGRIAVLVDGTPYALIVPHLFIESFQNFDDYAQSPWYVGLTRLLRFAAFLFTILLPGFYVAVASWHQNLIPPALLYNLVALDNPTPFPLMVEAIFMHLIYELMMEAGLRLPRPIGHAMSIVGALVIGDAIVRAGLVTSTMVTVLALTAIASFVVPSLYNAITVLRFACIILGGFFGLYGLIAGSLCLLCLLCRAESFGVPYLAPITPFTPAAMRDVFIRESWRKMGKRTANIHDLNQRG